MDKQQKMEWLSRYQEALRSENVLIAELEELKKRAVLFDDIKENKEFQDAVYRLNVSIGNSMRVRAEIAEKISSIKNQKQQEVLRRRYILGQNFRNIAAAMCLVERRVYQIQKEAIDGINL